MSPGAGIWRIAADTGGTFTDAVATDPEGRARRVKVLSSSALRATVEATTSSSELRLRGLEAAPAGALRGLALHRLGSAERLGRVTRHDAARSLLAVEPALREPLASGTVIELRSDEPAPVLAARLLTGTARLGPLPPMALRFATTRGTNALLERRGAAVALFLTRGFGDLLRIGTQARPDLFALAIERPAPLAALTVEVDERLAATGEVLLPFAPGTVVEAARAVLARGIDTAAVALLHSWRNPAHELALAALLRELGFRTVVASATLAPFQRLLPRAETALVEATLAPVVGSYLDAIEHALGSEPRVMTSAGGLVSAGSFRARDSLLSGPAGGVVGAARAARASGFARAIAFDMGGTSTDVARIDGEPEHVFELELGGARLHGPALGIATVAAGGGSICQLAGPSLAVGPGSAGADPGPACYGAGGPLTVTDLNLLAGRLVPETFEIPLRPQAARAAFDGLVAEVRAREEGAAGADALLDAFLEIVNERMADAIRSVSLRRGHDPAGAALVAFGGAGGQHALAVAERLGIDTVLVPAEAGLLSARGVAEACLERIAERQILQPLADLAPRLEAALDALADQGRGDLASEGVAPARMVVARRIVSLRLPGQDASIPVEHEPARSTLERSFETRFRALYGHAPAPGALEVESLRVIVRERETEVPPPADRPDIGPRLVAAGQLPGPLPASPVRRARFAGTWREVPLLERSALPPGATISGPALIGERHAATVVEAGWSAEVDSTLALVLRRDPAAPPAASAPRPAVARRELYSNRFRAIAEEMGERLRATARSTNIKERLDFSCAVLDGNGFLVVNAPHIPVHLGSLGLCVRSLRGQVAMEAGDVIVTNHPGFGGSHLPDLTVVTPVWTGSARLLGYVASRAHHAELGGSRPGSMPPDARCLAEEGVVILPRHLLRRGEPRWDGMRALLQGPPHPSRAVADNLADLAAQVAANHFGAEALLALAAREGEDAVAAAMAELEDLSHRRARTALAELPRGRFEARARLDDGTPLAVAITLGEGPARIDFSGSGGVHPGNLNATEAIVRAVVLYVLRVLVAEPLPLNDGLLAAVELHLPPGLLAPPFEADPVRAPAVVGGNTETSQALANLLLRALGLVASGQGTMNNVLFGSAAFAYYETVAGGAGAGPGFEGASGVHTHMTNTRITDAEVIEHRYPVRIERFALRPGSGGEGRHRGGDGLVREYRFLAPMSLSLLSQRRSEGPEGLCGGGPGLPGRNLLVRRDGASEELAAIAAAEVEAGDRLVLSTPGGGGYGRLSQARERRR